jgi:7,8-dihydropterin-6-yl-methyl-4-(beta-D-ribofuranosyl)aminobenzene 5'-phosphate synthase
MKKAVRIKAQPCFTRYFPQQLHNLVMSLIRDLKITTLAENLVMTKCLGQWGLSFLLEFTDAKGDRGKLIFDTGIHKESLMYNIEQLKVDLSDVDGVVISHGHGDHTAATVEVVEAAGGVKVYAHPHTFLPRFYEDETGKRRRHGVPKGEGLEEIESAGGEIILAKEPTEVVPGVWTTGQIQRATPFERALPLSKGERLIIVVDGEEIDDHILDDQALWMDVDGVGPFVLTGCAHAGSVNTLLQVQQLGHFKEIHGLAGGTHLVGRSEEYLQQTIESLKQFGLRLISPCHCTGFKATARLWQAFPRTFVLNFAGRVIEAGKEPERRLI